MAVTLPIFDPGQDVVKNVIKDMIMKDPDIPKQTEAILKQTPQTPKKRKASVLSGHACPRSPGTHVVGPWVIDSIDLYRDLRTGTRYTGNWASRVE